MATPNGVWLLLSSPSSLALTPISPHIPDPHILCAISDVLTPPALLPLPGPAWQDSSVRWLLAQIPPQVPPLPEKEVPGSTQFPPPRVLWEILGVLGVPGEASPRCHLWCRAVRALCDHTGTADGHLSFQKGDILELLSTVDEDWIRCCHGNSTGLVPVGYTSLIL